MSPREICLTTPDLVVLGFLMERPMYGYQIVLGLKERQVKHWAGVSRPQVYYSLKKLETSELIRSECTGEPALGPERRVFSVLPEAITEFRKALGSEAWATKRLIPPFSTWAMLSIYADRPTVEPVISRRRAFLVQEIAREELTRNDAKAEAGPTSKLAVSLISLVIRGFELELSWLDELDRLLADEAESPNNGPGVGTAEDLFPMGST